MNNILRSLLHCPAAAALLFSYSRCALPASAQTPVAGQAVVSDIDVVFDAGQQGIYSNFYDHQSGPLADHPWISIGAVAGERLNLELFTNFPSTFWLYKVLDGDPEPGDTPFGPTPDLLLLAEPDFSGTLFPRLGNFETPADGALLVQVDSYYGDNGRFGFQLTRLPPVPEPASVFIACLGLAGLLLGRRQASPSTASNSAS